MKQNRFLICFIVIALALMLLFPKVTLAGCKNGLLLWYQQFLPAVFPFMILSGLLTRLLKKGGSVFAVAAGFLNGYPMGAKTAADLKKRGLLPEHTACYYGVFCNMPGPMFLATYANLKAEMPVIYLTSIFLLAGSCLWANHFRLGKTSAAHRAFAAYQPDTAPEGDYLMQCTAIMVKAGIYMMYFSILINLLSQPVFTSPLLKLLLPFLELTTGIAQIGAETFPWPSMAGYFRIFLCVSGGLCTAFQSREFTYELNLPFWRYLLLKILQAVLVCGVCYGLKQV